MTDEQLLLLNCLMYKEEINKKDGKDYTYDGYSISEIIDDLSSGSISFTSKEEWQEIINLIKKDPELMSLKITDINYEDSTGASMVCFYDENKKQAYAVFRGTGDFEWEDNFKGGYLAVTPQQRKALDWINSLPYDNIIVSGHSKGGNKAQFVAYLSDKVSKCVSFDGQGLSKEFAKKYWAEIQLNKEKITCYATEKDYVNMLLNYVDLGDRRIFVKPYKVGEFIEQHCVNSLLTIDGDSAKFVIGKQSESMKLAHEFTVFVTNCASYYEKRLMMNYLGEVVQNALGNGDKDLAIEVAMDPDNYEALGTVIGYLIRFVHEKNLSEDQVDKFLIDTGLNELFDLKTWHVILFECATLLFVEEKNPFSDNNRLMLNSIKSIIEPLLSSFAPESTLTLLSNILPIALDKAAEIEVDESSFKDYHIRNGKIFDYSKETYDKLQTYIADFDNLIFSDLSYLKKLILSVKESSVIFNLNNIMMICGYEEEISDNSKAMNRKIQNKYYNQFEKNDKFLADFDDHLSKIREIKNKISSLSLSIG